jgi:nucleotide-binding universal stress UspA family protein
MAPFVISNILAPTDLGDASTPPLEYARMFADRFSAKLTVIYSEPILYPVDVVGPGGFLHATAPEEEQRLRAEVIECVDPIIGGRPYEVEVSVGQPVPSILAAADEKHADLIVMGTHLRHGWRRALLGSVSDAVIHGSHCPVLTVAASDHRPREHRGRPAVTKILCPINFTDVALDALHAACRFAEAFGTELLVVHVIEPGDISEKSADEEKVRQWVAPHLGDAFMYRELVVRGGAAERVLDCADDFGVDLIIAGARHRTFRATTVIGTTTERLIRFSPCPVLVVPRDVVGKKRQPRHAMETEVAGTIA